MKPSGDFFFPDPRSGDGFACEDEGDGDGGLAATPVYNVKSEDSDAGGGLAASDRICGESALRLSGGRGGKLKSKMKTEIGSI